MAAPIPAPRARRHALLNALAGRPAVVAASGLRGRNYPANPYRYRASSHFLYLVGEAPPGALLWLDGDTSALLLPPRPPLDDLWHGPTRALAPGFEDLRLGRLAELDQLIGGRAVATFPPLDGAEESALASVLSRDAASLGRDEDIDGPLLDAMIDLRLRHDQHGLRELREAVAMSVRAHGLAMATTRAGKSEAAICATMLQVFGERDCTVAYEPIVTVHGEVLHNQARSNVLRDGELLLADVGAESTGGYASDITRTWPVNGRFSAAQRDAYHLVLTAQQAAIQAVKPGVRYRDVHQVATLALTRGLCDLGILRGDPVELHARGCHALFMPHGIGHLLGLDVHDMEDLGDRAGYAKSRTRDAQFGLSYLRLDRDLVSGMVVTIEPGFYQVPSLLAQPERVGLDAAAVDREQLARFADVRGIRIEDDVLVTDTGAEVLSAALPKAAREIEALVGNAG